ncbi:hypothetical protein [Paenibacillus thermotolerans]|uniref:hypothetical protein n=1 Tax=Paenibacillus thermotolerans TaxID=3027807 RepID=UPI002367DE76|nr:MULTISPECIES: hypothetical protein [unclassified Paenibacillus]
MKHISIWNLKNMPLDQVVDFITENSQEGFQAKMASAEEAEYSRMSPPERKEALMRAIFDMNEESYEQHLLEIIDE